MPTHQKRSGDGQAGEHSIEDYDFGHLKGAEEKAMLEEDLRRMRCHRLMQRPWYIKYEKIMQELQ